MRKRQPNAVKIAPQADLWYNEALKMIMSGGAANTPDRTHLKWRCIMTTLPLPAQNDNIPEKRCTGPCGRTLPVTTEYFRRDKRGKNGFQAQCKLCRAEYNAGRREIDRQLHKKWLEDHKDEQKQYNAQYYAEHRDEKMSSHDEWKRTHQDEIKSYTEQYRQEHPDRLLASSRKYNATHREERRKNHLQRRHTDHGRNLHRTHEANRRSRKKAIPGKLTTQQIQEKLKAQRYCCYYAACGHAKFETRNGRYIFHLEHTIPVSRTDAAPRHDINYVVLACPSCNLSKNDRLPHEWPEGGRLL